jgi:hypothetical protein
MPQQLSLALRAAVDPALLQLHALSEIVVANPMRPGGWSPKQELGHLIDSATNNHVRFVVAALENRYCGPKYDANGWVDLHGYAEMDWTDLVDLWYSMNLLLARAVARIPEERLAAECRIGEGSDPVTLRFVIEDYVDHMQGHLRKFLRLQP